MDKREEVMNWLDFCIHNTDCSIIECDKSGCPYLGGSEIGSCFTTLMDDAFALLKAQEPRVMTLEEVKMLDSDYYYLESMRSPGKELREIVGAYGLTCVTWPSITWARQTMGDSGYGKTWRCWTSRPDEKRRAETPWN